MPGEAATSRAGQRVGNRYRLKALLEQETASDLYSGVDETSQSKVWVRVLHDEYALQPKVLDLFAELPRQLMRQIARGLPRVLAVGNDASGVPYTVWEQLEGRDLAQALNEEGKPLDFARAMEWMAPVMSAVARLHDLDKAHGELRPESVLLASVDDAIQPKLLHVGRPRDPASKSAYVAPELARSEPNAESDVFSLGAILFRMLSGVEPEPRRNSSLSEVAPEVPEEVAALVDACLAPDPDARPPNALELLARAEKLQKQLRGAKKAGGATARRARPAVAAAAAPTEAPAAKKARRKAANKASAPREADAPEGPSSGRVAARRPDEPRVPRAAARVATRSDPTGRVATRSDPTGRVATRSDPTGAHKREAAGDEARSATAEKPLDAAAARRDLVSEALARARKDSSTDATAAAGQPGAEDALAERRSAVQEALDRAKKGAPKPNPEEAEALAARQATVEQALARAKTPAAAEPKPESPGTKSHNTHLYEHLWARKEKKKRNPVYTYAEVAAFAVFAWLLMRFTPALTNPRLDEVEALIGPEFKVIGVVMAAASITVVGRLHVLQSKIFGSILQPVVMSTGGTAMCITVAATAPFAGDGVLQPFQALARQGLYWFNGAAFAMGGLFLVRWGKTLLASQVPVAAGSFAGAFMTLLSAGGMFMHGLDLPKEVIDFSREVEDELAEGEATQEEELEEGEIGPDGAKKVSLKLKGNLKDEAKRVANRKRAPGDDPFDEASLQEWEAEQEGSVELNQRKEMGGGADDEKGVGVEQLQAVRKDNAATMKGIQKAAKAKMSFSE